MVSINVYEQSYKCTTLLPALTEKLTLKSQFAFQVRTKGLFTLRSLVIYFLGGDTIHMWSRKWKSYNKIVNTKCFLQERYLCYEHKPHEDWVVRWGDTPLRTAGVLHAVYKPVCCHVWAMHLVKLTNRTVIRMHWTNFFHLQVVVLQNIVYHYTCCLCNIWSEICDENRINLVPKRNKETTFHTCWKEKGKNHILKWKYEKDWRSREISQTCTCWISKTLFWQP